MAKKRTSPIQCITIVTLVIITAWASWLACKMWGQAEQPVAVIPECPQVDCQCQSCERMAPIEAPAAVAPILTNAGALRWLPAADDLGAEWNPQRFSAITIREAGVGQDLSWMPPPLPLSLYKQAHGKERFQIEGLETMQLHTTPNGAWLPHVREAYAKHCPGAAGSKSPQVPRPGQHRPKSKLDVDTSITVVTTLLDLKREHASMGQFTRPFKYYTDSLQRLVDQGFPMVIFAPKSVQEVIQVKPHAARVHWVDFDVERLKSYFPYWERVQEVRTSPVYLAQAKAVGYLDNSPQKQQEAYNPLVMSKVMLLRDAARLNPFGSEQLLFIDAAHMCAGNLRPGKMPLFKRRMNEGFLVTSWPYGTGENSDVHGMPDRAMHVYMGTQQDPFKIVRGGLLGGRPNDIECFAKAYQLILWGTLQDGYMGTEENALALTAKWLPGLVSNFDNNSLGTHGDNCAAFEANERELRGEGPF